MKARKPVKSRHVIAGVGSLLDLSGTSAILGRPPRGRTGRRRVVPQRLALQADAMTLRREAVHAWQGTLRSTQRERQRRGEGSPS